MTTEPPTELQNPTPDASETLEKVGVVKDEVESGGNGDTGAEGNRQKAPNTPIGKTSTHTIATPTSIKRNDTQKEKPSNGTVAVGSAMSPEIRLHSAKRRRVDAHNLNAKTRLTRPFRSPLKLPMNGGSVGEFSGESSGSPQGPSRSASNGNRFAKPAVKAQRRSTSMNAASSAPTSSNNPPFKFAFTTPKKLQSRTAAVENVDPEIVSLQKELQNLELELKEAKVDLERTIQAVKIEKSGEDKKLEELIVKWRLASQRAADHLFEIAEERVEKMGGVQVWKEMNERGQMGGASSWGYADHEGDDNEEIDPEEKARLKEEYEAEYGVDSRENKENGSAKATTNNNEEFTMDLMLKTLNIDLKAIGYDTDYQRWK